VKLCCCIQSELFFDIKAEGEKVNDSLRICRMSKRIKRKLDALFRDDTIKPEAGCQFKTQMSKGK
jgi:hypothetical protein